MTFSLWGFLVALFSPLKHFDCRPKRKHAHSSHQCLVQTATDLKPQKKLYPQNALQAICFIHIGKCCAKKVHKTVRAPTMSINHVSLFNQQRIFVTEKLLIQTAFCKRQSPRYPQTFTYVMLCRAIALGERKNCAHDRYPRSLKWNPLGDRTSKPKCQCLGMERKTNRKSNQTYIAWRKSLAQSLDNNQRTLNDMAFCIAARTDAGAL